MRIGILFLLSDLPYLERKNADVVVIIPGSHIDELDVTALVDMKCVHLNEYLAKGEASDLSRPSAAFVRFILSLDSYPPEALACQNDIYQYHLRMQFLFLVSLERYLSAHKGFTLIFPVQGYSSYVSPMRPEQGLLYNQYRTLVYLSSKLANSMGGNCENHFPSRKKRLLDRFFIAIREKATTFFVVIKLFQKVFASKQTPNIESLVSNGLMEPTIGIIVRTDSEVVSANALLKKIDSIGLKYLVIKDEILSSTTTSERLKSLEIPHVSIGSMLGFSGIFSALKDFFVVRNPPRLMQAYTDVDSLSEKVLFSDISISAVLLKRLFDFFVPQRHFYYELKEITRNYNVNCFVTFAYVDQWGGVVKAVSQEYNFKTVAIQNAAQDPEEYPKLCWADYYCVESVYLKNCLTGLGYPADQVYATGLPHLADGIDSDVGLAAAKEKKILILTQPIYHYYYLQIMRECAAFCERSAYTMVIKYHPRQSGNEYATLLSVLSSKCRIEVFQSEPLDDLILDSKLVISVASAAIIRSLNLGVPTLAFLPKGEKHLNLYYTDSANLFLASNTGEIKELFARMHHDYDSLVKDFQILLANYRANHCVYESSPSPVDNVANVIKSAIYSSAQPE